MQNTRLARLRRTVSGELKRNRMAASSQLRSASRILPNLKLCTPLGTTVRFSATKTGTTGSRIQGETIGFDQYDTIKQSGSLAQGDLKSQPGESARRAAEEKVGREVSTTPSESGERKQEGSEQEKASKREETAAEAGI